MQEREKWLQRKNIFPAGWHWFVGLQWLHKTNSTGLGIFGGCRCKMVGGIDTTDPRNIVSVSEIEVHEINSFSRPKLPEKSISAIFRKIRRAPCEKIAHFEKVVKIWVDFSTLRRFWPVYSQYHEK